MTIWRHAHRIAAIRADARITLGEGDTPLVRSRRIGPALGIDLNFKLETCNPSGSYKDRFAAAAISAMVQDSKSVCLATSSGNTGSALAAYCAAAGIACEIALVETAPPGKIKQMQAYGARLVRIRGFGIDPSVTDLVLRELAERGRRGACALQISAYRFSPVGMSGVETKAHELVEQTSDGIDHVFCPAGGGGLTLAVARGFERMRAEKLGGAVRVECVQPEGNDTIAGSLRQGLAHGKTVSCTTTVSGLQVPNVIDADEVIAACRRSGGTGHLVTDQATATAHRALAVEEGIFSEPAGAVALAATVNAVRAGEVPRGARVVCLVTGSAFKDPASLDRLVEGAECPMLTPEAWSKGGDAVAAQAGR
jgi:threonine synthase